METPRLNILVLSSSPQTCKPHTCPSHTRQHAPHATTKYRVTYVFTIIIQNWPVNPQLRKNSSIKMHTITSVPPSRRSLLTDCPWTILTPSGCAVLLNTTNILELQLVFDIEYSFSIYLYAFSSLYFICFSELIFLGRTKAK